MIQFELPSDCVTDLQKASIARLIETLKRAKSADIHVRKDGQHHVFEADWLKHLIVK